MPYTPLPYPVNLCLDGQRALVVGGGPIAARKVVGLLQAGACVTVVAPAAVGAISENPEVVWHRRAYRPDESRSYRLVVTATSDPEVNAQVARDCEAANVFVNSADDPANCTFTLPSVARRGHLQVTVSTGGRSPALARWLRQRIEREIDSGYTALLELLAETRAEAKATFATSEIPGWETALDSGLLELVRVGRTDEARSLLRRHLGLRGRAGKRANPLQTGEAVAERPSGRSEHERETPRPDATGLHLPTQVPDAAEATRVEALAS